MDDRREISVVIIAFNEERNISRAIGSARPVAAEVIVLDSGSTDATREIASSSGAIVHTRKFDGFASQKNAAVAFATKDYVFVLDADEEISSALAAWLAEFSRGGFRSYEADGVTGLFVPRKSSFLGRWINHSGWFPDYTMRLIRRGCGEFQKARVHESIAVRGKTAKLPARCFMWHYTYDSLEQYFNKFNSYTTLAAEDLFEKGRRPSKLAIAFNPLFGFLKQYFIKRGFLDGFHGFVLAVLSALYVFVKYSKHYFLCASRSGGAGTNGGRPEK